MNAEKGVIMSLLWSENETKQEVMNEIEHILNDGGINNVFLEEENREVFSAILVNEGSKKPAKAHILLSRLSSKINVKNFEKGDFEPSLEFGKHLVDDYKKKKSEIC
jgi:hypothetical protein